MTITYKNILLSGYDLINAPNTFQMKFVIIYWLMLFYVYYSGFKCVFFTVTSYEVINKMVTGTEDQC